LERDDTQGESISQNSYQSASIPKGFGRITRDEAGQILHIEMAEGEDEECHPDIVPDMGALGLDVDDVVLEKWTTTMGGTKTKAGPINIVQGIWSSPLSRSKLCYYAGGRRPSRSCA
jgi:nucleolar protein 16